MRTGSPNRAAHDSGYHRAGPGGDVTSVGRHAAAETPTELVDRAGVLLAAYDFAGAYQLLIEVRSRVEHGVEVEHTDAVDATRLLVEAMLALGQADAAAELVADLLAWPGLGPYQAAMLAVTRARLLTAQHRLDEAAACYRDITRQQLRGPGRWPALLAMAGDAAVTAARGRPATAEPALTLAYTHLVEEYGTGHVDVVRIGVELTQLRMQVGGHDAARRLVAQLVPTATAALGEHHPLLTQLHRLVDRDIADRHRRNGAAADTGQRDAPIPAAAPTQSAQRRRHLAGSRSLPYWTLVTIVVCLGIASATAVLVVAIAKPVPAPEPTASRPPAIGPASTRAPWTPVVVPAGDVRIVRDTGTTIDVAWTDPSGGTRPTVLFVAKDDAPAVVAATVQAASTSFRLTGLDPRARRYCIGVAVAYSPTTIARSPDACTSRPTTPNPRRSSTPSSPRPPPSTAGERPATTTCRMAPDATQARPGSTPDSRSVMWTDRTTRH